MNYFYIGLSIFIALIILTIVLYLNPAVRNSSAAAGLCEAYCLDHIKNITSPMCITNNISYGYACEVSSSSNVCTNSSKYVMLNDQCKLIKIYS